MVRGRVACSNPGVCGDIFEAAQSDWGVVEAIVYGGLTPEQEAWLFTQHNESARRSQLTV
jgi:hypothetical protein